MSDPEIVGIRPTLLLCQTNMKKLHEALRGDVITWPHQDDNDKEYRPRILTQNMYPMHFVDRELARIEEILKILDSQGGKD